MAVGGKPVGRACAQLSAGQEIEALHNGRILHRRRVTDHVPDRVLDPCIGRRIRLDLA